MIRAERTGVMPEVVVVGLEDLYDKQYFFERNMPRTYRDAEVFIHYACADLIEAGGRLSWEGDDYNSWLVSPLGRTYSWVDGLPLRLVQQLRLAHPGSIAETHWGDTFTTVDILDRESRAISHQLEWFRSAKEALEATEGLLFFLEPPEILLDGIAVQPQPFTNIPELQTDGAFEQMFENQPVFLIERGGEPAQMSNQMWRGNLIGMQINNAPIGSRMFLAFDHETVAAQLSMDIDARNEYIRDLVIAVACVLLIIVLFAIQMAGAGRRYGQEGVHLLLVDRPYLDLGLAIIIGWGALIFEIGDEFVGGLRNNEVALNAFFAAAYILFKVPVLLLFLSLAKHIKAGGVWKRTLICYLPYVICKFCVRIVKTLWAGRSLTVKVAVISAAVFVMFLIVGGIGAESRDIVGAFFAALFLTALIAFLLLRYAKRLRDLERGAIAVRSGVYGEQINVGGGELGNIAESISNIGASVNSAVEQRMKSERLKTELITNVSHDIRTPLTSIITYTDLLRHEGLGCEKAPEYLDVLAQKTQRLKVLTDELFEAAKAATGNIEVNIAELDMVSLINQVMGEMDGAISSSGLDVRFSHPEHLNVRADGRLMWRVMENLFSNALKYALPGSRVYVDVSVRQEPFSRIEVKNISSAPLNVDPSELTERFKRGDDSRADGGSGLGLSIVQSFVEAQGGKFEVAIDGDLFKATIWMPCA